MISNSLKRSLLSSLKPPRFLIHRSSPSLTRITTLHSRSSPLAPSPSCTKIRCFHNTPQTKAKADKRSFVPQKAPVKLSPKSRQYFKFLISQKEEGEEKIVGIMLRYQQSKNSPTMVFNFDFVTQSQIGMRDEPVSLEVLEDGVTPKSPQDSIQDGLQKLYIQENAFMKVLGATIDLDEETFTPVLFDREGNPMDPNN